VGYHGGYRTQPAQCSAGKGMTRAARVLEARNIPGPCRIACRFAVVYPRTNRTLFDSVRRHGALISKYYFGEAPLVWHFPVMEQDHRRSGVHSGRR